MAAINVCDKSKFGTTRHLKLNSINFSDKVYSLKLNICKEIENSLDNIGNFARVLYGTYKPSFRGSFSFHGIHVISPDLVGFSQFWAS